METSNIKDKDEKQREQEERDSQLKYGWFSFTPACLQKVMNNALVFMILMTIANIFSSGTANGLMGATTSSIEKRFQLESTQSSWIYISADVSSICSMIFITYIGSKGCHRPRWTAFGLACGGVACFLYALPHFTTPVYSPDGIDGAEEDENLCINRTDEDTCQPESNTFADPDQYSLSQYMGVFIISRILLAFGTTPLYHLAVTYLDDCLPAPKFSILSSIFIAGGIVGPALCFILAGYSLTLFTDFPTVGNEIGIESSDPRWVGAWWLGYLFTGIGLLLTIIPLSGYPVDLPGAVQIRENKKSEAFGAQDEVIPTDTSKLDFTARDIPRYLKDIATNWTFMFLALYVVCDMAIIAGFTAFGPKFLEVQYSLTPAEAGVIFGALVVPAGTLGSVFGGLLIERFRLSVIGIMKTECITSFITILMAACLLIYCEPAAFAGVNAPYFPSDSGDPDTTHPCNANCSCEQVVFDPVCSVQDLQYFSPCHAGCTGYDVDTDEYFNCSCIANLTSSSELAATKGICPSPGCNLIPVFCVMMFIAMVCLFIAEAMNLSAVLRCVPNTHRLFGMMCQSIIIRVVGTIPAPYIFGVCFDAACILWQETTCGETGACFNYDRSQLAVLIFIVCLTYKVLSLIFMVLAWKLYKKPVDSSELDPMEMTVKAPAEDASISAADKFSNGVSNGYVNSGFSNGNVTNKDVNGHIQKGYTADPNNLESSQSSKQLSGGDHIQDFFCGTGVTHSPMVESKTQHTML